MTRQSSTLVGGKTDRTVVIHCKEILPRVFITPNSGDVRGKRLHELMMGVHGLQSISSDRYEIEIHKGDMFSWEEVLPRAQSAFESFLAEE